MTTELTVLELGDASADDALAGDDDVSVRSVADAASLADYEAVDCVVVTAPTRDGLLDAVRAAREAVPAAGCIAVVDSSDEGVAALDAGATDAAPRDVPRLLARRVRNAAVRANQRGTVDDGGPRRGDRQPAADEKIRALHDVATRLEDLETEAKIFEEAVDAAETILEFDICYVGTVEDREIRPQAANAEPLVADPVIMSVDEGLAGRTVRTRETYVVDDAGEDPDADPVDDSYRAALSVPLGEFGVFQAVATEYAAFDGVDRELGELLAAHVTAAVERVRYEAAIRRERDRFAALFEHVPDAAVRYAVEDDDPVVESVNPAFERIFGHDADDAVGRSLVDLVVPDDARGAARDNVAALRAGEAVTREVERTAADGRKEFLLRTAPVDVGERATGYVIYTDLSDIKRRERALRRQNARLQQFASIVSHDLRNPLNVAAGRLEVAQAEYDDDAGHLTAARESLDRMEGLIDDLLALARQGQVVDDPEPIDVGDVAADAWARVDTGDAALSVGDLPTLDADPGRVQQLFENLFRNAVEHSSTGSRTASQSGDAVEHSSTSPRQAGDAVEHSAPDDEATTAAPCAGDGGRAVRVEAGRIERPGASPDGFYVADDGPGIPADERGKVLEHGYTTNEEGTGLGLAIVSGIADAHGWDVEITESETGGVPGSEATGGSEDEQRESSGARFEFRPGEREE